MVEKFIFDDGTDAESPNAVVYCFWRGLFEAQRKFSGVRANDLLSATLSRTSVFGLPAGGQRVA